MAIKRIIIGTRKSPLARWQATHVKELLETAYPGLEVLFKEIVTQGDRSQQTNTAIPAIGGKGLFTAELESALQEGSIDLAVHSLKDLPTEMDAVFTLAAIPERDAPFDVLVSRNGELLQQLSKGAVVGTSSPRRESQLRKFRSDFVVKSVRGNVDSRIAKLMAHDGEFDALILAEAGLSRLGRGDVISERLAPPIFLPAPGQGALAVQCATKNTEIVSLVSKIDHQQTRLSVIAERAFLHALGAGCSMPVAAFAQIVGNNLVFSGRAIAHDGSRSIEVSSTSPVMQVAEAHKIGQDAAQEVFAKGFRELMKCSTGNLPAIGSPLRT
jgi:hydroxymethylbilane synthase